MPETPRESLLSEEQPWWERTRAGAPLLVAFVRLGRAESSPAQQGPDEGALLRLRYVAGVEYIAGRYQAAQPLQWDGDQVTLFFAGEEARSAVVRAFEAATALRERLIVDLQLRVQLAVHAAVIPWQPEPDKLLVHPAVTFCSQLEQVAPVDGIALTEDVYLALPQVEHRHIAFLGLVKRHEQPIYVFPAGLAAKRDPQVFHPSDDLDLWDNFRRYANGPEVRRLRYVGFPLQKKQPPNLDVLDVFVAPTAQVRPRGGLLNEVLPGAATVLAQAAPFQGGLKTLLPSGALKGLEVATLPSEPISHFIARHRGLVVLGDPGSGKTTVLRWLAVLAARGPLSLGADAGVSERLLPLMVSVGRLADIRKSLPTANSVVDALARYFHDRNVGREAELRDFLERHLERGDCLVLLDGLDEVGSDSRESVLRWLETFTTRFYKNRFVVSARQVGYEGFALPEGEEVILGPFSDEQVRRYVMAFERARTAWENETRDDLGANRESKKLLDKLFGNARLRALAKNPFLLSALVLLHRAEGDLPRHRVLAYEIFSRTLCETWSSARRVVASESMARGIRYEEEAIPILGELALQMHRRWPAGVAPESFVLDTLAEAIQSRGAEPAEQAQKVARQFLQRAGQDVQILLERGAGQWGFLHLTFQEFFAAAGLLSAERFEEEAMEHLLDPRWEEVLRLGIGYMALVQKRGVAAGRFIDEKVLTFEETGGRRFMTEVLQKQIPLAMLLTAEAGDVLTAPLTRKITDKFSDWLRLMPEDVVEPMVVDLAATELRERLLGVLFHHLQAIGWRDRARAINLLGKLGGPDSVNILLTIATRDASTVMRLWGAGALLSYGSPEIDERLAELCRHGDVLVRAMALIFLGVRNPARAQAVFMIVAQERGAIEATSLDSLLAAFLAGDEPYGHVDGRAEEFLRLVRREAQCLAQECSRYLPVFARFQAWKDRKAPLDAAAAQSLTQDLLTAMESESLVIRFVALGSLSSAMGVGAETFLIGLLKNESVRIREMAVWGLSSIDSEAAKAGLLGLMDDPSKRVRGIALVLLAQRRVQKAVDPLLHLLKEQDFFARYTAIKGLTELAPLKALQPLVQVATTSGDPSTQESARGALWRIAAKVAIT